MDQIKGSIAIVLELKIKERKYPEAKIIVLNDNFNTFEHIANCLKTIVSRMSKKRAWLLTVQVDKEGLAEV